MEQMLLLCAVIHGYETCDVRGYDVLAHHVVCWQSPSLIVSVLYHTPSICLCSKDEHA